LAVIEFVAVVDSVIFELALFPVQETFGLEDNLTRFLVFQNLSTFSVSALTANFVWYFDRFCQRKTAIFNTLATRDLPSNLCQVFPSYKEKSRCR
jgi:hypothetical protein